MCAWIVVTDAPLKPHVVQRIDQRSNKPTISTIYHRLTRGLLIPPSGQVGGGHARNRSRKTKWDAACEWESAPPFFTDYFFWAGPIGGGPVRGGVYNAWIGRGYTPSWSCDHLSLDIQVTPKATPDPTPTHTAADIPAGNGGKKPIPAGALSVPTGDRRRIGG